MGSCTLDTTRTTKMASYDFTTTTTNYSSSSSYSSSSNERSSSVSSELDELLYSSMNMSPKDKRRHWREFYYPQHIAITGNYYPRYKVTGDMQTGTSHVSYLSRPYYNYMVPSRYKGYSKYVYINKM